MGFLAPWLLLGAAGVSLPLILHFFYKARYRKVPWAAMPFLKLAIEQTSRRLRFQEWVLLALRCALLLLLAFALARPTMRAVSAAGRGESVDAVFVFDTSFSMTARDGEKSRFERAKDAAASVLESLPPNSTVQIFACADRSTALGPVSPGNLDQAKQIVATLAPSSLSTDLLPGLSDAFAALDRGAGTNKEVYVFSDMQKSGWDRQGAAVRAKCEEIKQRATLLLVRCGSDARPVKNVSVADITFPGGIPHTGTRMPFTILLRNTGKDPVRGVGVTLEVDGKLLDKEAETVEEIGPGQTFPVTLTAKLDDAGPRVITARITNDDLPGDNRFDRIVQVRSLVRVLIVDGTPDLRDAKESGSHYLRNALLPVPDTQKDEYFVRVTTVPADEAGPGLLGACDVCILANVPSSNADHPGIPGLSPEFVSRLGEFVKAGGGLVIGCGDNVVVGRYNAVLGSDGAKLLPFDLEEAHSAKPESPFKLAPDTGDGFLMRFRDEPFRSATADAEIFKLAGTLTGGNAEGRILMRTSDGKPVLTSRLFGEGEVIFAATSLDAKWGNWTAKAGSFVSFVQLSLAHLTGKAGRGANRVAGEPITYAPPDGAKSYDVIRPDGRRTKLGRPAGGAGTKLSVTAADTSLAGLYKIVGDGDDEMQAPRFAVVPDLREADNLDASSDADLEQFLGFRPVFLQAGSGAEQMIATERSQREWTIWALLIVFGLAVGESFWAWMCGRAW